MDLRDRVRGAGGEGGFTLAELLVFLAIMVIFLIGVGSMISSGARSSAASQGLIRMENQANEAMVAITRQIRVANDIDAASGTHSITFSGYLDGSVLETVTLSVQEGYLMRGEDPWIAGVESMHLSYYDDRGNLLGAGTPGWNTKVNRVGLELVFARESMGIRLSRIFQGSATLRNDLDGT